MKCSPGSFWVFKWHVWSMPAHLDHIGLFQAFKVQNRSNWGESAAHLYTKFYTGEMSEWPINTRSSSIQKCLFIGMSHTGHQNFRLCNPACFLLNMERMWPCLVSPSLCVSEAGRRWICAGARRELRSRWACIFVGSRASVWTGGRVDGMNGTSGWLWVCVWGCVS